MPVPLFVLVSSSSARVHSCLYLDCQFLREGFDLLRFLPKFSATGDLKGLQTVKKLSRFYCCDEGHTGIARPKPSIPTNTLRLYFGEPCRMSQSITAVSNKRPLNQTTDLRVG